MTAFPKIKIVLPWLALTGLLACQQSLDPEDRMDSVDLNSEAFAVAGFDDFISNVEDATLEREMTMSPMFPGGRFHQRKPGHLFGPGAHLGKILRELGVAREQMPEIRELLVAQRDCAKEPLDNLRAANQDLIDAANAQRRAVLDSVRSGELTREQAHERIKAINASTRAAIESNPANAPLLQALCDCRNTLFAAVRALLTEEQQAGWDEWVSNLPEDWCS